MTIKRPVELILEHFPEVSRQIFGRGIKIDHIVPLVLPLEKFHEGSIPFINDGRVVQVLLDPPLADLFDIGKVHDQSHGINLSGHRHPHFILVAMERGAGALVAVGQAMGHTPPEAFDDFDTGHSCHACPFAV